MIEKTEKKMKKAKLELSKTSVPEIGETPFTLTPCIESAADTVGYVLKKARDKKDIQKIATQLRIRPRYLEALEQSRYAEFPGQAYALGFLRTYADFLGLDSECLLMRYRQERSFIKPEKLEMPIPEQQNLLPSSKYLLWSVLVIALIWSFWYFLTYSQSETPVPPIAVTEAPLVEQEVLKFQEKQETPDVPVVVEIKEKSPAPATPAAPSTAIKKGRVQIVAKDEVWVEIGQDDTLILSRSLKKGEVYDVPTDSENMLLKTGNAGGMDILVDGVKVKSFGPVGAVRSNISLSADKLKNR